MHDESNNESIMVDTLFMLMMKTTYDDSNTNYDMIYLEFQLHGSDGITRLWLVQSLDVVGQVACRDLSVAALHSLQQSIMDEDVLILGLNHVVPLCTQAGHMTVDVNRLLMLDALQHGINDDEGSSASHTSTERGGADIQLMLRESDHR